MEFITSRDGTIIGFRRTGSGPPLVLVHGTTADHGRWARVAPVFEAQHTVYAIDRRGRGASRDGAEYALEHEVEDLVAVLEMLYEPANLVGHSFGAICALEAALHAPSRLRRLVLYEPPISTTRAVYSPDLIGRLEALVREGQREEALRLFFREVVGMPEEELALMRALPWWKDRVAAVHTVPREMRVADAYRLAPARLRTLDVPALLLLGGESPSAFHHAIHALDAALPHARVARLGGQRHVAMDTAPEMFAGEVLRFLDAEAIV